MPTYEYHCNKCDKTSEIIHSIKSEDKYHCENCKSELEKLISAQFYYSNSLTIKNTIEETKEENHTKKVKDFERAVKKRKSLLGHTEVGNPSGKVDPKHIFKKGRVLGGQQVEIDKKDFIKTVAKDDFAVRKAQEALKKNAKKN